VADNIRDEGRGPLSSIADRVVAKEIGKLWSVVENMRGYAKKTGVSVVTHDELDQFKQLINGRVDQLDKAGTKASNAGPGGSFTSISSGGPSLDVRPLDNLWTGNNLWKADNSTVSVVTWDPPTATMHFVRDDALPVKEGIYEYGSIFIDITHRGSSNTDPSNTVEQAKRFASLVPIHMHAVSADHHHGNAWGFATEAYNDESKKGKFSPTQLIGAEVSIIQKAWDTRAARHCGLLVVFKNRMDREHTPVHGVPDGNESYNHNSVGIYIDTGAGRRGNNVDPIAGNAAIQCGWHQGIYFSAHSLDRSNGNIWAGDLEGLAVGINMSDFEGPAPEGGFFYNRLKCAIALPPNTGVSWDGSPKNIQTRFNNATGNFEWRLGNTPTSAVNLTTGALLQGPGLGYFLNLGYGGAQLFTMLSDAKIEGGFPIDFTYTGMIRFKIDGSQFFFPFYRKP
jgi:hypothetical protein